MFVVVPQCQAVTWVMYVASAGAGHGWDPAGLTALAGILLWVSPLEKGLFHSEPGAGSAAQPALAHAVCGNFPGDAI